MKNKESYYRALIESKGQLNEIDLGEKMGLEEDEVRKIISRLLTENKIEYKENGVCNYNIMKVTKRKNKRNYNQ